MLTTPDNITPFHQDTRRMGISSEQLFDMANFHHIAVGQVELLRRHHTQTEATMMMLGSEAKSNPLCKAR